jgi:hypothetical protein
MAVFRIEKTQNYTVMSNHHLRNKVLSLKAKGLLSQMLSLPDTWDYTLVGLSKINRESVEAIRTAVLELEAAGYITRRQTRDGKGKMSNTEYTIYELPQEQDAPELDNTPLSPSLDFPITDNPTTGKPTTGKPTSGFPTLENPTQLKKEDISNKEKIITDSSSTHQSIYPATSEQEPPDGVIDRIDGRSAAEIYFDIIKDNIEYDYLCMDYDPERVTEILELIHETVCSPRKTIRIGGEDFPAEVVKSRFMKLGQFHVEYVFDCINKNTTKIRNIKAYLLTTLYNAPTTMGHYYTAEVAHDMASGKLFGGGGKW